MIYIHLALLANGGESVKKEIGGMVSIKGLLNGGINISVMGRGKGSGLREFIVEK